ncbi:MAG: D-alanine--D-alanine ligase [Flavobacteriales bacterium]|nr:D-alanine--D-alanine ligase [Flavobacteriales bacterium]
MKKRVAIVFGGYSSEWVISEMSAKVVFHHLDAAKYEKYMVRIAKDAWTVTLTDGSTTMVNREDFSFEENGTKRKFDAIFNAIHGTPGEDGKLQGYWDMLGIPYTSPGVLASSLTFSKSYCNGFLRQFGDVNIAASVMVRKGDDIDSKAILDKVGLPCFVKPNNLGSSFGITKLKEADKFDEALAKALENDDEAVIEQFINGAEIASGVYSHGDDVIALPLTEIVSKNEYFDYQAKYEGASEEITPARIPDSVRDLIQETTRRVFKRLKLRGMSRIDYIVQDGVPYLIEVNTIPGLSEASLLPQQVRHSGMTLKEFFGLLVEDASRSAT